MSNYLTFSILSKTLHGDGPIIFATHPFLPIIASSGTSKVIHISSISIDSHLNRHSQNSPKIYIPQSIDNPNCLLEQSV
jgi:hypothetical protein